MKLTNETFETNRSNTWVANQPKAIRPKDFKPSGTAFGTGNGAKGIAVLSVIAVLLAIASVSIIPQIRSETAIQDLAAGIQSGETTMPFNQYPDFSGPAILPPSPTACCATIVAQIAMR